MDSAPPSPIVSGNGWGRRIFRVILLPVIAYLLLALGVLIFQRKLIYFPTRIPAGVIQQVAAEHGFLPWTNSVGQIIGWRIPASGPVAGSVLICHGNAGSALGRDYIAQPIHDAEPVDVYVLEYPGYGARDGSPGKSTFDAAAEQAFQLLPANRPRYVVSESIGTGVACELARNHSDAIAGLALIVPYHDLASVAQKQFWFLPAYYLLRDRWQPAECLKRYHGPVKILIAGSDEILGPQSGQRLFDEYQGPKSIEIIPGAHHNDVAAQLPDWWRKTFQFWSENKSIR